MQDVDGAQGNCFSACLASLFELPLDEVPNFWITGGAGDDEWWGAVRDWLKPRGFGIMTLKLSSETHLELFEGLLIVSGQSRPGRYHATIWKDGVLVHDPSSHKPGITAENVDMLYPLDPASLVNYPPSKGE